MLWSLTKTPSEPATDRPYRITTRTGGRQLEVKPPHTVLVEESPSNLPELHAAWPNTEPDTFYTFASGGLGWNLPGAVCIALGERESGRNRSVIAVIGDGSFQYSVQSIWTAAQHDLPTLFVVPRNGGYVILKSFAVV